MDELSTDNTESMPEMMSGKGSLRSLLGLGKSQECTFVVRTDGVVQEGSAFYDGGNARIDTLVTTPGAAPVASYVIMNQDSNTMYMWGTAQAGQGIKMTIPQEGDMPVADTTSSGDDTAVPAVTPDMDVDYTCKSWRVDGSVFVPPSDIEFMDMSEMQKMMEGMSGMMPAM
jgi:hypothetical protein